MYRQNLCKFLSLKKCLFFKVAILKASVKFLFSTPGQQSDQAKTTHQVLYLKIVISINYLIEGGAEHVLVLRSVYNVGQDDREL